MKYIYSFGIILIFVLLGEFFKCILPFPIPSSIYGMILLFLALKLQIVKLEQVEDVSKYLISIMIIFFVIPAVSLMNSFNIINGNIVKLLFCIIVPIVLTIISSAVITNVVEYKTK